MDFSIFENAREKHQKGVSSFSEIAEAIRTRHLENPKTFKGDKPLDIYFGGVVAGVRGNWPWDESKRNKPVKDEWKLKLPALAVHGVYGEGIDRHDSILIDNPNPLVQVDVDGLKSESQVIAVKQKLSSLEYCPLVFVSPSGDGVKALVRVNPAPVTEPDYDAAYDAVCERIQKDTGFQGVYDDSVRHKSVLVFLSHDEGVHYNPDTDDAVEWVLPAATALEKDPAPKRVKGDARNKKHNPNQIREALSFIKNNDVDWEKWRNIGFALHHEWVNGRLDDGFEIFDGWSSQSPKYDARTTQKTWDSFKENTDNPITIGSIYQEAMQGGFKLQHGGARDGAGRKPDNWEEPDKPRWLATWLDRMGKWMQAPNGDFAFYSDGLWNVFENKDKAVEVACRYVEKANKFKAEGMTEPPDGYDSIEEFREAVKNRRLVLDVAGKPVFSLTESVRRGLKTAMAGTLRTLPEPPLSLLLADGTVVSADGTDETKPEYGFTKRLSYSLGYDCERTDRFISELAGGDEELVDYLWRTLAKFVFRGNDEGEIFILAGASGSGKSTYGELVLLLLEGYATVGEDLDALKGEFGTSLLAGNPRVVVFDDPDSERFPASILKRWATMSTLRINEKYKQPYTLEFNGHLLLTMNEVPPIYDVGLRRRIRAVELSNVVQNPDIHLLRGLREELPGVIAKLQRIAKAGDVSIPQSVLDFSDLVGKSADSFANWADGELEHSESGYKTAEQIYGLYKASVGENEATSLRRVREKLSVITIDGRPLQWFLGGKTKRTKMYRVQEPEPSYVSFSDNLGNSVQDLLKDGM